MFDLWGPEHSVLREKVVEHIFLAELSRALLLDLGTPFEVLRAEFDASGYDVAIEARGYLRHVQLKATASTGRRASVDVQLALADKPGGCVVWIYVDPQTLALGPFFWFGGGAGQPLPPLGDREVKHSRGDATGAKKVRAGLRRLPRGAFTRFDAIGDLAMAMFPPPDHSTLLQAHVARHGDLARLGELARGMTYETSAPLAYLIDGYELAAAGGIEDPIRFANRLREQAVREGAWSGSALELWLTLFMEHRRDHFSGSFGVPFEVEVDAPMRDELCAALAQALLSHPC